MKRLTEIEIKFIKETGWTPTLEQMNYDECELKRTPYKDLTQEEAINKYFELASKANIDLVELYKKCTQEHDAITLEYDATYLLYTFFTQDELVDLDTSWALQWLQDFKYYCGYRKWDEHYVELEIQEALEIYAGIREFYDMDGEVWNREVER